MTDAGPYRHTQTATRVLLGGGILLAVFTVILVSTGGNALIFAGTLMVAIALLMNHSIEVTVNERAIEVRAGNGWLRRSVRLDEVVDVGIVRVGPSGGLIARRSQGGWVFAAQAGPAVRVETQDGGVVVIGSNESQALVAAIERMRLVEREHDDDRPLAAGP